MRKYSFSLLFPFLLFCFFFVWACQKGINWDDKNVTTTTDGSTAASGWSAALNDTAFHGCIDTAFYSVAGSAKTLQIGTTDSAGNSILISLVSATGSFSPGTFGSASNNGTAVVTKGGDSYTLSGNSSFSFVATEINDTVVAGTFTATLNDSYNRPLKITDGKISALIGKTNVCTGNTAIVTGGGSDSAAYTLTRSGTACSIVNVTGTYTSGTTTNSTNQAQVEVTVTQVGKYSVTTPAVNGITFSASGAFTATGKQTLTLQASGTPVTAGTSTVAITAGSSTCSFSVRVQ